MTLKEWLDISPSEYSHRIKSIVGMNWNLDKEVHLVEYASPPANNEEMAYFFHLLGETWYIYQIPRLAINKKNTRNSIK